MGPIRNPNWSTSGMRVTLSYLCGAELDIKLTVSLCNAPWVTFPALLLLQYLRMSFGLLNKGKLNNLDTIT